MKFWRRWYIRQKVFSCLFIAQRANYEIIFRNKKLKDPKIDSSLFKELKAGTIHLDDDEEDELPKEDKKKASEAVLKIKSPVKPLPKESPVKSPAKSPVKSPVKPSLKSPAKSPVTSSQKKTEEKKVSTPVIPNPSDTPTRVTRSLKRKSEEEVKEKPPAKKEKIKKKKETVGVYEVEYIKGKKIINGKVSYHVHWKGYESSDDTWEPVHNIIDKDLIEAFEKKGKWLILNIAIFYLIVNQLTNQIIFRFVMM